MKYVLLLPTRKMCFLAGGNRKLCVAHLTLFYYMKLLIPSFETSYMGIMCLTLSWYTIKADVSATHKPSLVALIQALQRETRCCCCCLHYYQKKKKNRWDNFPDVGESRKKEARVGLRLMLSSNIYLFIFCLCLGKLFLSLLNFLWFRPMKHFFGGESVPLDAAINGRWKLCFLADFILNGFSCCYREEKQFSLMYRRKTFIFFLFAFPRFA